VSTTWLDRLRRNDIVLLDGGTGSELQRRGMSLRPDVWSGLAAYTHRALLTEVHRDFIAAGADIITTNTFSTSRFVLEAAGCGEAFAAINRSAVAAAREARDEDADVAIAGAMSCFPPRFDAGAYPSAERERAAYRELAELLAHEGVDLITLEMLEDTEHAARALDAALEVGLPVALGVSARLAPDGTVVMFDFPGVPLAHVLDGLLGYAPTLVNVMHTELAAVPAALALVKTRWEGLLGAYPELPPTSVEPREFAALAAVWVEHGARLVGGCCGTTPAHIRALHEALPALRAARRPVS
jgi:S-methylmethionine-dependent homocysteine/selenocysteine methylase